MNINNRTLSIFPFSKEQVRVLIFRECDWNGRRVLFDSSAVREVSPIPGKETSNPPSMTGKTDQTKRDTAENFIGVCNGIGYVYAHTAVDNRTIGEMIFGSVAMSVKGSSLKVTIKRSL